MAADILQKCCACHNEPRDPDGTCKAKRRERQRRYWTVGGWARRRERRLAKQLREANERAEDLGLA